MEGKIGLLDIPIILPKGTGIPPGEKNYIKTKATINPLCVSCYFPNIVQDGDETFHVTLLPMGSVTFYVNMEYDQFNEWLRGKMEKLYI